MRALADGGHRRGGRAGAAGRRRAHVAAGPLGRGAARRASRWPATPTCWRGCRSRSGSPSARPARVVRPVVTRSRHRGRRGHRRRRGPRRRRSALTDAERQQVLGGRDRVGVGRAGRRSRCWSRRRPLDNGAAVVLASRAATSTTSVAAQRRRLLLALALGLLVALAAGAWWPGSSAARSTGLAATARRLTAGERGRRPTTSPARGPREVVDVAEALRQLDRALADQRGAPAALPAVGLARAAHAADLDPRLRRVAGRRRLRPRRAARRRRDAGAGVAAAGAVRRRPARAGPARGRRLLARRRRGRPRSAARRRRRRVGRPVRAGRADPRGRRSRAIRSSSAPTPAACARCWTCSPTTPCACARPGAGSSGPRRRDRAAYAWRCGTPVRASPRPTRRRVRAGGAARPLRRQQAGRARARAGDRARAGRPGSAAPSG